MMGSSKVHVAAQRTSGGCELVRPASELIPEVVGHAAPLGQSGHRPVGAVIPRTCVFSVWHGKGRVVKSGEVRVVQR